MANEKKTEEMNERELLMELVRHQKKSSRTAGILLVLMAVITAVALYAAATLVPRALRTVARTEAFLETTQASMGELDNMAAAVEQLTESADRLLAENTDSVTEAVSKIKNIDFDSLNNSIHNLSDILEPLAKFFNLF